MSSRNSRRIAMAALLAAALGALVMPLLGSAGTVATEDPIAERPPALPKTTLYQVRCWQYGRLLFEERDLEVVPAEMVGGVKLRGNDRHRQPVMVTDTGNATCLIRSSNVPPGRR